WNYATVHAYGPLRVIDDRAWLRGFVEQLTARYEGQLGGAPWKVGDAPEKYLERMVNAIIGVEVPIARIEGKWKVSQNRTTEDRAGVVAGLERSTDPQLLAIAALVRERS